MKNSKKETSEGIVKHLDIVEEILKLSEFITDIDYENRTIKLLIPTGAIEGGMDFEQVRVYFDSVRIDFHRLEFHNPFKLIREYGPVHSKTIILKFKKETPLPTTLRLPYNNKIDFNEL